jgi:hypothetical protein
MTGNTTARPIRKGYVVFEMVWLSAIAFIVIIGYLVYGLTGPHRSVFEGILDLMPLFIIVGGFVALMMLALKLRFNRPNLSRTIVEVWFAILLLVSFTAVVSLLGLLVAPAAYYLFLSMSKKDHAKST